MSTLPLLAKFLPAKAGLLSGGKGALCLGTEHSLAKSCLYQSYRNQEGWSVRIENGLGSEVEEMKAFGPSQRRKATVGKVLCFEL